MTSGQPALSPRPYPKSLRGRMGDVPNPVWLGRVPWRQPDGQQT